MLFEGKWLLVPIPISEAKGNCKLVFLRFIKRWCIDVEPRAKVMAIGCQKIYAKFSMRQRSAAQADSTKEREE